MVNVSEAISLVRKYTKTIGKEEINIEKAQGCICAEDVKSVISFPSFPQSAMDGYAINYINGVDTYKIGRELKAGDDASDIKIEKGEAIRIFTGAMVPMNANMVIRQEDAFLFDNQVKFLVIPSLNSNIRPVGEQIEKGEVAIKKHTVLNPASIGFLAMLGIEKVKVFKKPKISIITTGSELLKLGEKYTPGKIFESNSFSLAAAFEQYGFHVNHVQVSDSYNAIKEKFESLEKQSDLIVFTGGISVGDYDFVGKVLEDSNVTSIFYKVKQKPGKPIYFGIKDKVKIFALPGNPAASLISFYLYVLPCLEKMIGRKEAFLTKQKVGLLDEYVKNPEMTHFLKGRFFVDKVEILPAQSSATLNSFVQANCILLMEEGQANWEKGDMVDILVI